MPDVDIAKNENYSDKCLLILIYLNIFKGRAKKRIEELQRLMEIAKKNFSQLGGRLLEDRQREAALREKDQ